MLITSLTILFCITSTRADTWTRGTATNYGPTDSYNSNYESGTGRCWGPDSYRIRIPCFDSITDPNHVGAVNTRAMTYTNTIGTCVEVRCVNGPLRGLRNSTYPFPGCDGNSSVVIQITDSCPAAQNADNIVNCGSDPLSGTRHIDMATPAFTEIALTEAGNVDILFKQIDCPDGDKTGVSWNSWERKYNTTIQDWSKRIQNDILTTVEGNSTETISDILLEDEAEANNRTGVLPPLGKFSIRN